MQETDEEFERRQAREVYAAEMMMSTAELDAYEEYAALEARTVTRMQDDPAVVAAERLGFWESEREAERETVKQVDIFGRVHDTYATEAELNGWRPTQGTML